MSAKKTLLYIAFLVGLISGCKFSKDDIKAQDNWTSYRHKLKEHPRFKTELNEFQELRSNMVSDDFDYESYLASRTSYLNKVQTLIKSDKSDSLKLGVLINIIASYSIVNSKEKEILFSQVNSNLFSTELIENFKGYLGGPKYQIGDRLDVEKIFSEKSKSEIPLELTSEVNIIFFWSSWCANCDRYYTPIDNLIEKYSDSQLNVIGISLDQKESKMKKYEQKHGFRFTSYSDLNKKWKSENAERFGVKGIPVCFVVDKNKNLLLVNPQANYLQRMVDGILKRNKN